MYHNQHPIMKAVKSLAYRRSFPVRYLRKTIFWYNKEVKPPKIEDPEDEILSWFDDYVSRFEAVDRKLSSGDCFVIACSQAIAIGVHSQAKAIAGRHIDQRPDRKML